MEDFKGQFDDYIETINSALDGYFLDDDRAYKRLHDSMRYSLLSPGKRVRATMVLEFCRISGGNYANALPVACAIEMLHAYSLIHDDLPCMDNDELRRGRKTNHIEFDEATAVLAGDALQTEAFATILTAALPAEVRVRCAEVLAKAAGSDGMCAGQMIDMLSEGIILSKRELKEIHSRKTSALFEAACVMGVIVGGGTAAQEDAARAYAAAIGLAFQVRDDMLDLISTVEELGKPIGSDKKSNKTTFATAMGLEACESTVNRKTQQAKESIQPEFKDTAFLEWLSDSLSVRRH